MHASVLSVCIDCPWLIEWKYSNYFLLNENYAITIYLILTEDENMTPNFCCVDLQLPVQSVPMTTKIVGSNPSHAGVYSTGRWFSPSTPFPQPIKLTATI